MENKQHAAKCMVISCEREIGPHGAKGLCPSHYKRHRVGAVLSAPFQPKNPAAGLTCSVDDCERPVRARGWCSTHHQRWRVRGSIDIVLKSWDNRKSKVERIWDFVDKDGPIPAAPWRPVDGNCWLWTGYLDKAGYGWLSAVPAHRRIFELEFGPIEPDMVLDHLCRVHACVRPDHFEVVTRGENASRNIHRLKTHCPTSHAYDAENTYIDGKGGRRCRACARARKRSAAA